MSDTLSIQSAPEDDDFSKRLAVRRQQLMAEPQPVAEEDPFTQRIRARRAELLGDQQIGASLTATRDVKPERAAELNYLSTITGLPRAVIETEEGEARARAELQEVIKASAGSPVLRAKLAAPSYTELAKDDVGVLSKIEKGVGATARYLMGADEKGGVFGDLKAGMHLSSKAGAGAAEAVLGTVGSVMESIVPLESRLAGGNPLLRLAERYANIGREQQAAADASGGGVFGVSSGVASLAQNAKYLPLLALGPVGAVGMLTGMTVESFGGNYRDAREAGLSQMGALVYGTSQAGVEYWTERVPAGVLMESLAKGTGLLPMLTRVLGQELKGEQIATVLQDLNEWAAISSNNGKTFRDYLTERPSAALETAIATVIGTGGQVTLLKTADKLLDGYVSAAMADQVGTQQYEQVQQLMGLALQSKLRERDPALFRETLQEMLDVQGPEKSKVYVDGEVLQQLSAETRAALGNIDAQIEESIATGVAVEIPLAAVLAATPGTPDGELLMQYMRSAPGQMSAKEMADIGGQANQWLQQGMQRYVEEAPDAIAAYQEYESIKADIQGQLDTAARTPQGANAYMAEIIAMGMTSMAQRLGRSAMDVYNENKLTVTGQRSAQAEGELQQQQRMNDALAAGPRETQFVDRAGQAYTMRITPQVFGMGADRSVSVLVEALDPATGQRRGFVDFATDGQVLMSENTKVAPASQRRGLAEGMYRAAREAGFDIAPGRMQTEQGDAMVRTLMERGVINAPRAATIDQPETLAQRGAQKPGKAVPAAVDAVATVESAFEFAGERQFSTNRDFKIALQTRVLEAAKKAKVDLNDFSQATEDYLVRMALADGLTALRTNANAVGWYNEKVSKALATISLIHPEIATDPRAKFAFVWAMAVTSNGLKVDKNFELAEAAYVAFKNSSPDPDLRRMPTDIGIGTAAAAINRTLGLYNSLIEENGFEALEQFMTTTQTVKQVEQFTGQNVSGENLTTTVYGAAALGPKIGNGFFMNLYGRFEQLTIDRWLMRTWGRWTGTLVEFNPGQVKAKRAQLKALIQSLSPSDKKAFEAIIKRKLTVGDPDDVALAIWKASQKQANRVAMSAIGAGDKEQARLVEVLGAPKKGVTRVSVGDELRKGGNALAKYMDGQKEVPTTPERSNIRKVFGRVLAELQKEYPTLTMSDYQALLWYPEKRLYDAAKTADESADGYEDNEAPDYANAAAKLARARGIGDDVIAAAVARVDAEIQAAVGAGGVRPGERGLADGASSTLGQTGVSDGRRDGAGGYSAGGLAPLEGAPQVVGASGPDPRLVAVAERYARSIGVDLRRPARYVDVDPERAARIAAAYDAMQHAPQDPAVHEAYENLIAQTRAQYDALVAAGYSFSFFDSSSDPYAGNPWNAMRDLRANQRMAVYATADGFGSDAEFDVANNPLLADTGLQWPDQAGNLRPVLANDLFRAVHDAFGHGLEGAGFRAQGEENAWQAHVRLFTGSAVGAITTETRGQNSWLNYGPFGEQNRNAKVEDTVFADQKTGLMPEWTWSEGRVADMDDGTQAEQRRMRQAVDLSLLQKQDGETLGQLPAQTETPQFKAWFGDSKVVDADGKPLVVYHGTQADFSAFNFSQYGRGDDGLAGKAFYFSDSAEVASGYAMVPPTGRPVGANVVPVYLSASNPLVWDYFSPAGQELQRLREQLGPEGFVEWARARGHDSVKILGNIDGQENAAQWVVFDPTQIKSAIGNDGGFSTTDPNILRQDAKPGQVGVTGVHFSRQPRTMLMGAFYGSGLQGAERDRVFSSDDTRLRERTYFYVDEGKGVRPEAGVGGYAHSAELPNLYDINSDPLKLIVGGDINATESNVLNAGFDGYYRANAFNQQGAAVVIGQASRAIAVAQIPNPTTAAPPREIAAPTYTYGLLAREAAALDIDAIRAVAPSAQVRGGNFRVDAAEFEAAFQAAAAQGVTLPAPRVQQGNSNFERGTFNVKTLEIVLTENADLSTFIHEAGHFFLEMLMKYGGAGDAPPDVRADAARVLKWFGVPDIDTWMGMTLEQKRPYHERWAESFEQYKFEGKAPTKELQPVYRRFSAFLKQVYGSVQNMLKVAKARGSDMTLELNDEIRGVMDRIMSADAAVQEAEERLGGAVSQEATDAALETLEARSLRNVKWLANARTRYIKKLQAEAAETRKRVRGEVEAEVKAMAPSMARRALDALRVVPEHQVLLDQWKEQRAKAQEEADADSREAALAEEEARSGSRPAGLKLGAFLSKHKREINNAAERRMIAWDRENPRPLRPANANDQDLATIADSFGYPTVDDMMSAIRDFGSDNDVISAMTDQRMLEDYGDLVDERAMEEAANEAVHNEARTRAVAAEIAAETAAMNPRADTGEQNAGGVRMTVNVLVEAAKRYAEQAVAKTLVRDLRQRRAAYNAAERKAGSNYTEAKRKGKNAEAIAARQQQLLNTTTAKAMNEAIAEAQKMVAFLRKVLADSNEDLVKKGRDPDVVNAMRAVLFEFGVGTRTTKSASGYLQALANSDPETADTLRAMVEPLREFAQPVEALAFGELKDLHDAMQAMWFLSKQMRQMEVGGEKIDVQEAADELSTRLFEIGVPPVGPGDLGTMTDGEKRVSSLRFMRAALTRMEQWAQGYGPEFTKYLFRPIKEAADRYRSDRVKYRKAYIKLLENIAPALKDGTIVAPELGNYTFGRGKVRGHAELLHAILHTGNASNKRKLLLGRGWASENDDGTLNTEKWDAFVERMQDSGYLRKEHYDFAQRVWDLLEEIKPIAQRAHREVYGRYFDEVTAESFETPFGAYRGGYVPAQASMENAADADRAQINEQNEALINAFPSAPRGFTKSRVDYNTKLSLDLGSLGTHIDQVLRFAHMQPAVRGVTRLLKNKTFSQPMAKVDNGAVGGLILPFLQRASRQSAETPVYADGGAMRIISIVRGRAGMALMMGNLLNAVQQLSGFVNAAARVRPALMVQAAAQFIASPKRFNAEVGEASPFMRERMRNEIAAINEAMEDVLLDPTLLNKAQSWTNRHAYFLQAAMDNTMSPIVWTAAYNQEIAAGKSHEDAAFEADAVVRTTQTTTLPEDISRAESGNPLIRLFTQFANYFNMLANTYAADLQKLARDGGLANNKARALYVTFTGLLLPIWVAEGIALAFRGGPEDEDEDGWYWDDWIASVVGMGTARSLLAAVPGVGQIGVAAINRFNDNPLDDRASLSPVVSLLESAGSVPYKTWQLVNGEDVKARTLINDAATAITVGLGLPVRPLVRPVGYLAGVAQGEITPTSNVDFARGLLTGAPSPESKE